MDGGNPRTANARMCNSGYDVPIILFFLGTPVGLRLSLVLNGQAFAPERGSSDDVRLSERGSKWKRRDDKRRARRVPVRFWKKGEDKPRSGFTTNISDGGMFIGSNLVHGRGTRLRIEVLDPLNGFIVEGVVARANRSQPHMQRIRASGMGIRFLQVSELVAELFPTSAPVKPRPAPAPAPSPEKLREAPPTPPPQTAAGLDAPGLETADASDPGPETPLGLAPFSYALQYRSREELRISYERDISQGGLFINTSSPAPLQEVVVIEIHVTGIEGTASEAAGQGRASSGLPRQRRAQSLGGNGSRAVGSGAGSAGFATSGQLISKLAGRL